MENQKNYILGLDTGTNSIGFCLIDEDNKIVKKNDKNPSLGFNTRKFRKV